VSNFVDHAQIDVYSGKGGAGSVSCRKEKYVPRGGPDGGNGGRGGSVIIFVSSHLRTLLDYKYKCTFKAESGHPGSSRNKTGRDAKDLRIPVPRGTVITDADTGELLVDLKEINQEIVVATGGRGGKGNAFFVSATNQAPKFSQPGEPGESRRLNLELKLLADIGLVGLPNAGKSTLISVISKARPKIAGYPFTTLVPHLGVVRFDPDGEFVVADIPGIIKDSSQGKGLGDQFLRHIERSAMLLLLVDVSPTADVNPIEAPEILLNELHKYQDYLDTRAMAVVATKIDVIDSDSRLEELEKVAIRLNLAFYAISAVTHNNIQNLLNYMKREYLRLRNGDIK